MPSGLPGEDYSGAACTGTTVATKTNAVASGAPGIGEGYYGFEPAVIPDGGQASIALDLKLTHVSAEPSAASAETAGKSNTRQLPKRALSENKRRPLYFFTLAGSFHRRSLVAATTQQQEVATQQAAVTAAQQALTTSASPRLKAEKRGQAPDAGRFRHRRRALSPWYVFPLLSVATPRV